MSYYVLLPWIPIGSMPEFERRSVKKRPFGVRGFSIGHVFLTSNGLSWWWSINDGGETYTQGYGFDTVELAMADCDVKLLQLGFKFVPDNLKVML